MTEPSDQDRRNAAARQIIAERQNTAWDECQALAEQLEYLVAIPAVRERGPAGRRRWRGLIGRQGLGDLDVPLRRHAATT